MSAGAYCSPLGKIAEITDFLYLGGLAAAKTEDMLKEKGITCVINGKLIPVYVFGTNSVNTGHISFLFGMSDSKIFSLYIVVRSCFDKL